jgi:hypothetical protein
MCVCTRVEVGSTLLHRYLRRVLRQLSLITAAAFSFSNMLDINRPLGQEIIGRQTVQEIDLRSNYLGREIRCKAILGQGCSFQMIFTDIQDEVIKKNQFDRWECLAEILRLWFFECRHVSP